MARDSKGLSGWKGSPDGWSENSPWCENLKPDESVEDCIKDHTFGRSDVVKDVLWGYNPNNSILTDNLIHEDFTMEWQGKFFALDLQRTMVFDDDGVNGTRLSLVLGGSGLTFQVFIHDPNFFEMNYKPIFPVILKTIDPATDFNHMYNLVLTEVRYSSMPYPSHHMSIAKIDQQLDSDLLTHIHIQSLLPA